ncbi:VanZ like family protein [Bacillus sp. THAF10]|uniref:VanZ family protein n=1 Tax=Bacillus sp. THAF10 TaxID=2587848 RepID=UPI0012AA370D|nr:VanZ family protein [Bacillus sp. THAF10]QFT91005.1 VanZ like family protein [Bacillus sp. THAF10]
MKKITIAFLLSCIIFAIMIPAFPTLISNLHPIVLPVLFLYIFVVTLTIYLVVRGQTISIPSWSYYGFFVLYTLGLIVLLFLRPNEQFYGSYNIMPLDTIFFYFSGRVHWFVAFYNLAANIVLFIPFGVLLRFKGFTLMNLILLPFLVISLVEVGQYVTNRGSLDVDDLLLNVIGFYIGYLLYPLFRRVFLVR